MPEPHLRMPGPPIREGSPTHGGAARVVHSPPVQSPATHDPVQSPATHDPVHSLPTHDPVHSSATHNPAHAAGAGDDPPLLSRRVPQAHLAPELRRGQGPEVSRGSSGAPLPDAAEARAALSRYQASRQAARAMVDEDGAPAGRNGEAGPEHPPTAGGWS